MHEACGTWHGWRLDSLRRLLHIWLVLRAQGLVDTPLSFFLERDFFCAMQWRGGGGYGYLLSIPHIHFITMMMTMMALLLKLVG